MRVLHGRAQRQEELQAGGGVERARLGELAERHAFHVLHDQVGQAVGGRAAVEQTGDVRMVEAGENLALGAEAPHDRLGVHPAFEDLEGDALMEHVVVAHRQEHGAHAALAQLADQPVGANARVGALDVVVEGIRVGSSGLPLTTGGQPLV